MKVLVESRRVKTLVFTVGMVLVTQLVACSDGDNDMPSIDGEVPDVIVAPTNTELQATVRRTTNGVPHIQSDTLEGVAFGAGYAQAQDNVCLLAEQFVKARSERAKYFGPGEDSSNIINDFSHIVETHVLRTWSEG